MKDRALSKFELDKLGQVLRIGDPIKDFYDEADLIYRLYITIKEITKEVRRSTDKRDK